MAGGVKKKAKTTKTQKDTAPKRDMVLDGLVMDVITNARDLTYRRVKWCTKLDIAVVNLDKYLDEKKRN